MDSPEQSEPVRPDASVVRARQLGLVALCVLGLVVAAFAMPAFSDARASPGESSSGLDATPTPATGGSDEVDAQTTAGTASDDSGDDAGSGDDDARNWTGGSGDEGGSGGDVLIIGASPPPEECVVGLEGKRVPGAQVRLHVWRDRRPVADRAVWFNGRYVGTTDAHGRVAARIPYSTELRVEVALPDDASCRFLVARRADTNQQTEANVTGANLAGAGSLGFDRWSWTDPEDGNASGTYTVNGTANVSIQGEAYPGKTVTLEATIDGVPMREATVRVDGERVGRTDVHGRYRLRIPADGTERLAVSVTRGDFEGATTVDVLRLRVDVVPTSIVPVPGTQASIHAAFGGNPAANATVAVDGRRLGTTDGDGRVPFQLPLDPGTTVRVRAAGQVTTTSLWPVYAPSFLAVGLLGVLLAGSHATAHRRGGRRGLRRVAVLWVAVGLVVGGVLVAGRDGGLAAFALVALVGVGVVLSYRGSELADAVRSFGASLASLVQWLLARALRVVGTLERLVLWAHDLFARVRNRVVSLPRSVSALAARVGGWIRALPSRVRVALVRRLDSRSVAAVALALVLLAAAAIVGDATGFLAMLGLLAVVGVAALVRRNRTTNPGPPKRSRGGETAVPSKSGVTSNGGLQPSLREMWRSFARWVAPGGWRRRTPGEVSRAAIERGFPRESVVQFTRVFREVEYDDRPLSPRRLDRATEAFEALEAARRRDGEGDEP